MTFIKHGWGLVRSQFPSVIILFLYQLLWGFFLYRLINSAVVAVLSRYPDPAPTPLSKLLYSFEAQLELQHNASVHNFFWWILGMIGLRLLLSPLLESGILYGLLPPEARKGGLPFFRGMKEFGKPVALFYLLELVLLILPAFWLVPVLLEEGQALLPEGGRLMTALTICGYLLLYFLYGWVIRQMLLFAKFGVLFRNNAFQAIWISLRHALDGLAITVLLSAFGIGIFLLFGTVSWAFTGIVALLLQQTYPFIRSIFQVWTVTSQYQLWQSKSQKG